jgi:hypothetical protein
MIATCRRPIRKWRGSPDSSPRRRLVLDGEIVALDERGAPSFSLLQQRMHVLAPTADLMARVPAAAVRLRHPQPGRKVHEWTCPTGGAANSSTISTSPTRW